MTQKTFFFPLEGGLDLVTPVARMNPGRVIGSKNYEPNDEGGYRRLQGYERFDGRPSPSEASYWILQYDQGSGAEVFAGDIITGLASAATAEVLSIDFNTGAWGVDAAGELRLFNLSGIFEASEALQVSASTRCLADGVTSQRGAATDALDETYQRAAIEARRADIGQIPGGDPINGVWLYNGNVYALRENYDTTFLTAGTISFTSSDTIADSGSGLGIFTIGDRIIVVGSTGNSIEWDVDTAAAGVLTVSRVDLTAIVTEAAGPSITIGKLEETQMHKSGAGGWTKVDLGDYLDFSVGTVAFTEGATITGSPSNATATVVGTGVTTGRFTVGDAAGRIYISGISGTFTASDTLVDDGVTPGAADCDSAATSVSLPRGGKYEFQNYNFFGTSGTLSMWGCNSVSRGFRYNSTTGFAFVHATGLSEAIDKPEHLEAHKKHLFFSFGSSVQFSSQGEPLIWNAITGAGEISTGDRVTSLENQKGDILGIFNRNRTYLLYGDDVDNWDLVNYSLERGAIEWSVQDLGVSVYTDDRGVHRIAATDAYGDLSTEALSALIDPFIQETKSLLVESIRLKSKSQYRYFNSDKTGLILRTEGNKNEFMPFEYDHRVYSTCAEEDSLGFERAFFGSDSNYVYEMEKGESFDGAVIVHSLRLAFCHCQSPRQKKRFHKATVQIQGRDDPGLTYSPDFSYGGQGQPSAVTAQSLTRGGGIWGVDLWSQFVWDGSLIGEAEAYIRGQGINVSLLIQGSTNFERVHTIEGVTYNYSVRGLKR